MKPRIRIQNGVTILKPAGQFYGGQETYELESAIRELGQSGNQKLLINLADVQHMNSLAINALILAHNEYKSRGAELRLCHVGSGINNMFVITRLCMVFGEKQHDTEGEALEAFRSSLAEP